MPEYVIVRCNSCKVQANWEPRDRMSSGWYHGYPGPNCTHGQYLSEEDVERVEVSNDAPTENFQAGYEAAIEDITNGTVPMWIVGCLDELEFMGQEPEVHGISVRAFFELDIARAYARTASTDPDEAVIVPVKQL